MSSYNTHTHIFNVPSVPDAFITNYRFPQYLSRMIRAAVHSKPLRKTMLFLLKRIPISVGGIQLRRYAALVEVAVNKYQGEVFESLMDNYTSDTRFVILTMNFDYMTGEAPAGNYNHYETQLHEVLEVKKEFGEKLLPFLFIDPRKGRAECTEQVRHYFDIMNIRGMAGIKIYPPLGYYPFHPAMEPVYAFAEENGIPIISHCNKDGGAYYSGRYTQQMLSYNSFNPTQKTKDFLNSKLIPFPSEKPRFFANILMHPLVYYDVLEKFPKLKICLAHYGGDQDVVNQDNKKYEDNWTLMIKELMMNYENVYTDVSFTLTNPKANKIILRDMQDPRLQKRILFGTDFFLTAPYENDKTLSNNFFEIFKDHKKQLTETNPLNFLDSKFFTL